MNHIAIIGAGTAGLATALVLARQGIQITIFESVSELAPVGAGLLLQPAGLAVFAHLGVLESALTLGAVVTGLEGQLPNGHLLVNSHYREAGQGQYGLGIHRATLCHVLIQKLSEYQTSIHWRMNHQIDRIEDCGSETRVYGTTAGQAFDAAFDAVIVANGARSTLRPPAWVRLDRPYPWGAAWMIVPECLSLDRQILHQFYDRSQIMMGVLPTGAIPSTPDQRLSSVFWSLPTTKLHGFMPDQAARGAWLAQVDRRWPTVAAWLNQVIDVEHPSAQWLSAQYRDVVMSQYGHHRIGVIGDAAHAMSPQLGQGANMALLDAWALGQSVASGRSGEQIDWSVVWQHYHRLRGSSTLFYQSMSRLLTPLYQSDHWWAGVLRDVAFTWMYRVPYLRREMAVTISGLKTGMLSQMQYAQIATR